MRKVVYALLILLIVVLVGSIVRSNAWLFTQGRSTAPVKGTAISTSASAGSSSNPTSASAAPSASEPSASTSAPKVSETIDPAFKEAMDSYETLMNGYVDFMVRYKSSKNAAAMLSDYGKFMQDYSTAMSKLKAIDEDRLNSAERAYYLEVTGRVTQRMAEVM